MQLWTLQGRAAGELGPGEWINLIHNRKRADVAARFRPKIAAMLSAEYRIVCIREQRKG